MAWRFRGTGDARGWGSRVDGAAATERRHCCRWSSREFAPYHPLGGVPLVAMEIVKTRRESPASLLFQYDGRESRLTSEARSETGVRKEAESGRPFAACRQLDSAQDL